MTTPAQPTSPTTSSPEFSAEEVRLSTRNHGMPLEMLRSDVTPVGLHYVLTHYDIPHADADEWVLTVTGRVERGLELTIDDLRERPSRTRSVTMECAGNGRATSSPRALSQPWFHEAVGTARWTGTPLRGVLDDAGVRDDAVEIVFTGLDRGVEGGVEQAYQRSLDVQRARGDEVLLVYEMNGEPLPPQHGFPLRLLVPGWYGMASVKWLVDIEVTDRPFDGYQQARAYRLRRHADEPGEALGAMAVRSLMIPPGIPDFFTRHRFVERGPVEIFGRAWSGAGPITAVEVSVDGGTTWEAASVVPPADPLAWSAWTWTWRAERPGDYVLCSRATDASGASQPDAQEWNLGGYAGNAVQRVPVTVR